MLSYFNDKPLGLFRSEATLFAFQLKYTKTNLKNRQTS